MKTIPLSILLLFQTVCHIHAEELDKSNSYTYFWEDEDLYSDGSDHELNIDLPKIEKPHDWQGKIGNAKVIVDVKNPDFYSECEEERNRLKQKRNLEKKKRSAFDKDEEKEKKDDPSSGVSISIKWGE